MASFDSRFTKYLATGDYTPAQDSAPVPAASAKKPAALSPEAVVAQDAAEKYLALDAAPVDLAAHDRRFHPNGYDPKRDSCGLRDNLDKDDKEDTLLPKDNPYKGFKVDDNPDFTRPQATQKKGYDNLEERWKEHNDPDYLPPNLRNPYVRKDGKIGMSDAQFQKAAEWERQHKDEIDAYRKASKTFIDDRKRENEALLKELESDKDTSGKSAIDKYRESVEKKRADKAAVSPSEPKKPNLNTPMGLYQHFRDQEKSLREKGATQLADDAKAARDDMAFLNRMQSDIEEKMGGGENASLDKAIEGLAPNLFEAITKARNEVKKVSTSDLKAALKEGEANNSDNLDAETRNLVFSLNNNSPSLSTGGNRENVVKSLDSVKQLLATDLLQNWVITCELKRRGESV